MASQRGWLRGALAILALLACIATGRAEDEIPAPPWAEEYFARQNLRQYLLDAEAYITSHPDSPYAPQVAFEAMMAASVENAGEPFRAMRRRLLFDYSQSFQATYLLSTFDAERYGDALAQELGPNVIADANASERRLKGIETAVDRWNGDLFENDELALKVAFLAQQHSKNQLFELACSKIAEGDATVAEILFDVNTSAYEKLNRLDQEKQCKRAKLCRKLVLSRLSDADKANPEVQRLELKEAVDDRNWTKVLTSADQILTIAPDDCRVRYWKCWALVGLERPFDAIQASDELIQQFPDDPWAHAAIPLREAIMPLEAAIDNWIDGFKPVAQLSGAICAAEAHFLVRFANRPTEFYLAISARGPRLETVGTQQGKVLFAYRATEMNSEFYIDGQQVIRRATPPLELPVPLLDWVLASHGMVSQGIGNSVNFTEQSLNAMFGSIGKIDLLCDRSIVSKIALGGRHNGSLMLPAAVDETSTTMRRLSPSIDRPTPVIQTLQFAFDDEQIRVQFDDGVGRLRFDANFSTTRDARFTPPKWPGLPFEDVGEFDATEFMQSILKVQELVQQNQADGSEPTATPIDVNLN